MHLIQGFLDVPLSRASNDTIANFGKIDVDLPKHENVGEATNDSGKIVHNEDEHYSCPPGAHANKSGGSPSTVHYEPAPDCLERVKEHLEVRDNDEKTLQKD